MKFCICFFLASWLISIPVYGQFSDDFSDGNLDGWSGDISHFVVNGNQQLQLMAPVGSTNSWIHTPVTFSDSMIWEMYIKLDFAPSTSNQLRIYLGLSGTDPATSSGYFLEIGTTGDQDSLELKYLDQGVSQSLGASSPGLVGIEPVEMRIRVIKKSNGAWECYKLGGVVPELLFIANHNLLPLSALNTFGYACKYTDTRRDKFYFDDINLQRITADTTAPRCLSIQVMDNHTVTLLFDELLDENSAVDPSHYTLTPGGTHPASVVLDQNRVYLNWFV
jgi:hypothetical protein